jgi:putative ABC transport system permease protein
MRGLWLVAVKSAWSRRQTLGIVVMALVMASAVLLAVERLRQDVRTSFAQSVSGVDLLVGARSSPVQLLLYAVFRTGKATQNMRMATFDTLAAHPAVAFAIPLSLGDSHRGFPVLGTDARYFAHWRYGRQQALTFDEGRPFDETPESVFELVLGHTVAKKLGYTLGDALTLSHGLEALGPTHADKPFKVVGILAPTGTPVDRSLHVRLEAITAIHLDWTGGAPLPGLQIAAEQVRKFDLRPREITAMLIGLERRIDVFKLQRHVNTLSDEAVMAVMPGVALDELWQTLSLLENVLLLVAALVVIVGVTGLAATLLAGLNERRRELAVLRALGASRGQVFGLLVAEGLCINLVGLVLGYGLLMLGIVLLGPWAQAQLGLVLSLRPPSVTEWYLALAILGTGLVASLLPGWRAWRLSLSDGLTPRF